jgi:hypothetical protein
MTEGPEMPDDPEERHIRALIRSLHRAFDEGTDQADLTRLAGAVMGDRDVEAIQPDAEAESGGASPPAALEASGQ